MLSPKNASYHFECSADTPLTQTGYWHLPPYCIFCSISAGFSAGFFVTTPIIPVRCYTFRQDYATCLYFFATLPTLQYTPCFTRCI